MANEEVRAQLISDLRDYGFSLNDENQIVAPSGKITAATVWFAKGGRLQVRNANKDLLWSGPRIGNFLERFWIAKKQ